MKLSALLIGLLVVVVGASLVFVLTRDEPATETADTTSKIPADSSLAPNSDTDTGNQNSSPDQATSAPATTTAGAYVDYKEGIIAQSSGTKILFFHAPWCPQCRALEADIKSKGVPNGVTIIKVDYDSNQALRRQYGVTIQTSLVKVDDSGKLVKKFVAYDDPSLKSVQDNLL